MRPMTYIEIAGKRYPMRFSLAAMRAVTEKFGSMEAMGKAMGGDDTGQTLETMAWIIGMMVRQGCEYKNLFEAATDFPKDAPVENGKYMPISDEMLSVALDIKDLPELSAKITEAMSIGQDREIRAEQKGGKKNEEAT